MLLSPDSKMSSRLGRVGKKHTVKNGCHSSPNRKLAWSALLVCWVSITINCRVKAQLLRTKFACGGCCCFTRHPSSTRTGLTLFRHVGRSSSRRLDVGSQQVSEYSFPQFCDGFSWCYYSWGCLSLETQLLGFIYYILFSQNLDFKGCSEGQAARRQVWLPMITKADWMRLSLWGFRLIHHKCTLEMYFLNARSHVTRHCLGSRESAETTQPPLFWTVLSVEKTSLVSWPPWSDVSKLACFLSPDSRWALSP